MGVDFYACRCCGTTFPDCGDYVSCECGEHWCSDDCAEADGYREVEITEGEYEGCTEYSCNFCREEDFDDSKLLEYALFILNKTRPELINDYKESSFNDEE